MQLEPTEQYEQLIRDFCLAVGIKEWEEIIKTQHFMINERWVGLIPAWEQPEPILWVYVEIGQTYPVQDGGRYLQMLISNLENGVTRLGYYAIHPVSQQAVYCIKCAFNALTGAQLLAILNTELPKIEQEMKKFIQAI